MTHALHSSERTDWQTPEWFLALVREVFGGFIELDPCTTAANPTKARKWITQADGLFTRAGSRAPGCGLSLPWTGPAFVNCPYGAHLDGEVDPAREIKRKGTVIGVGTGWAAKIAGESCEWIALVPNRTETAWWRRLRKASSIACLPDHRIAFVDASTGEVGEQPNHGSTVFYRGPRPDRFAAVFREVGGFITGGDATVGDKRGGAMREVDGLRRRTIQRDMTPTAKAEREAFIAKFKRKVSGISRLEIQTAARYERELLAGTFAWSSHTRVMADDDKLEIVYLDKHGCELWRRPQTTKERNLELPLARTA